MRLRNSSLIESRGAFQSVLCCFVALMSLIATSCAGTASSKSSIPTTLNSKKVLSSVQITAINRYCRALNYSGTSNLSELRLIENKPITTQSRYHVMGIFVTKINEDVSIIKQIEGELSNIRNPLAVSARNRLATVVTGLNRDQLMIKSDNNSTELQGIKDLTLNTVNLITPESELGQLGTECMIN